MTQTQTTEAPRSLMALLRAPRAPRTRTREAGRWWTRRRLVALALVILIPLFTIVGGFGAIAAHADETPAPDDTTSMKFSFYKLASSTTSFFSAAQEPESDSQFDEKWTDAIGNPGTAGSLLGYADPKLSLSSGWLSSALSGSSDAIGYDTLKVHKPNDNSDYQPAKYQGMLGYAYFGAALKGMGIDGTSTGLSTGFASVIGGGIVMILFILGGGVDLLFNSVVGVLDMLNPFKLFYAGMEAVNPTLADGMVGNGSADVGPLSGLVSWIGGWYQLINSLAWEMMVPLFLAVLIFSLFMFKKMDRGGAFKKFAVRLLFFGIGIPLLGSMYSGMLTSMNDATTSGNTGSARVVASTYVDFESWAMQSRLAVPSDATIAWSPDDDQPSGKSLRDVRNTALAINNKTLGLGLEQIVAADDKKDYDASFSNAVMQSEATDAATKADVFTTLVKMLGRYIMNNQVSGADFETNAKGDLSQLSYFTERDNQKKVAAWYDDVNSKPSDLLKSDDAAKKNPLLLVESGKGLRASTDKDTHVVTLTSDTSACTTTGVQLARSTDGAVRACNLAPLAMYNYLNTDFGPTSMRMYSSANVASEATRSIHNSVNQVGTGTMSFLYWFNAVVLLGSFVTIGFFYAFGLLFASIKRSIQLVGAVPFAALGALAAIAKVIVYTLALMIEVVGTIFTYKLIQSFLTSLPQIIEMPFAGALNNGDSGTAAGWATFLIDGWGFALIVTVLSSVGVIAFTVLALRLRKGFVKAAEEAVTKLIEKFLQTSVGMPSGGGLMPALAGGLASGGGAAVANRMMNKGGASGGNGPKAGPGGNGPAGVTSSAGGTSGGPDGDGGKGQLEVTDGTDGGDGDGDERTAGAVGNGDPGSPAGELPAGSANERASKEVAAGREIEANGLSKREGRDPQVSGDALDSAVNSAEESKKAYKESDQKRLEAGKQAAAATGHAAIAAGRASAGDAKGAVESGGKALETGARAVEANERAKQKSEDAGRSSLDKPSQVHARNAERAGQAAAVGGAVAGAAGASKAPAGGQVPRRSDAPKPQAPKPRPPRPQQATQAQRPAPQQARPAQARPAQQGTANQALRQSQRAVQQSGSAVATANQALGQARRAPAAPAAPAAPKAPSAPKAPQPKRGPSAAPPQPRKRS